MQHRRAPLSWGAGPVPPWETDEEQSGDLLDLFQRLEEGSGVSRNCGSPGDPSEGSDVPETASSSVQR